MKIAINAINAKSYGITVYTIKLINFLLKHYSDEYEITIFTSSDVIERYSSLDSRCIVKVVQANNAIKKTLYSNLIFPFILLKYDLVHSVANLGILCSPKPQVITIHDTYEMTCKERFSWRKRLYMRFVINFSGIWAKRIITVSQNTAHDVSTYYTLLKKKTTAIYSGLNFPPLKREELIIPKKKFFLFVGTIEPGKNLILLLKAMEKLQNDSDYTLKVVGAKEWRQSAEIVNTIPNNVEILGKISDEELLELYKNARALIFPSLYEGFGLPITEALANGCPVIAANNSAIPEAGGKVAQYFEDNNLELLVTLIKKAIESSNNDTLLKDMQAGVEHASTFDWNKTAQQVHEVYSSILK